MAIGNKFSSELEDFFKFTIRVSLVLMVGYVIAGAVLLVILGIYSLFMAITSSIYTVDSRGGFYAILSAFLLAFLAILLHVFVFKTYVALAKANAKMFGGDVAIPKSMWKPMKPSYALQSMSFAGQRMWEMVRHGENSEAIAARMADLKRTRYSVKHYDGLIDPLSAAAAVTSVTHSPIMGEAAKKAMKTGSKYRLKTALERKGKFIVDHTHAKDVAPIKEEIEEKLEKAPTRVKKSSEKTIDKITTDMGKAIAGNDPTLFAKTFAASTVAAASGAMRSAESLYSISGIVNRVYRGQADIKNLLATNLTNLTTSLGAVKYGVPGMGASHGATSSPFGRAFIATAGGVVTASHVAPYMMGNSDVLQVSDAARRGAAYGGTVPSELLGDSDFLARMRSDQVSKDEMRQRLQDIQRQRQAHGETVVKDKDSSPVVQTFGGPVAAQDVLPRNVQLSGIGDFSSRRTNDRDEGSMPFDQIVERIMDAPDASSTPGLSEVEDAAPRPLVSTTTAPHRERASDSIDGDVVHSTTHDRGGE